MTTRDRPLTELRADIAVYRAEMAALRAYVEGRFNLLTWMVGVLDALSVVIFVKLFVHG